MTGCCIRSGRCSRPASCIPRACRMAVRMPTGRRMGIRRHLTWAGTCPEGTPPNPACNMSHFGPSCGLGRRATMVCVAGGTIRRSAGWVRTAGRGARRGGAGGARKRGVWHDGRLGCDRRSFAPPVPGRRAQALRHAREVAAGRAGPARRVEHLPAPGSLALRQLRHVGAVHRSHWTTPRPPSAPSRSPRTPSSARSTRRLVG